MIFCSQLKEFKTPLGAVEEDEEIVIKIKFNNEILIKKISLLICKADDWENEFEIKLKYDNEIEDSNVYVAKFSMFTKGIYFYHFKVSIDNKDIFIRRDDGFEGIITNKHSYNYFQLTVSEKTAEMPDSLKNGIMYQIFPDRFFYSGNRKENVPDDRKIRNDWGNMPDYLPNENGIITNSDYFCGDLAGIIQKLDYLELLGVTVIYLNPIFEAHSNHRYNTANYFEIDSLLGNKDDFKDLCINAHKKGIKIILDGVFNHTGDDSIYFNKFNRYNLIGAFNSKESEYFNWYDFNEHPNKYSSWWNFDTLPSIKKNNFSFLHYICGKNGVIDYWISLGADGFRLDVVDELSDEMIEAIRISVKRHGNDKCVIGEVWEDSSNKVSYGKRKSYLIGKQLDSVMNYQFKDAILEYISYGNSRKFYIMILSICENYPKKVLNCLMNSLSTHDTMRALTLLSIDRKGYVEDRKWSAENDLMSISDYDNAIKKFKLSTILQYFLPGIPCIYYGDEAGLYGYKDPFNRKCYPWGNEDNELINFFKKLGEIRKENSFLGIAEFNFLEVTENYCAFERCLQEKSFLIIINRSENEIYFDIPETYNDATIVFEINNSSKEKINCYGAIIISNVKN